MRGRSLSLVRNIQQAGIHQANGPSLHHTFDPKNHTRFLDRSGYVAPAPKMRQYFRERIQPIRRFVVLGESSPQTFHELLPYFSVEIFHLF
jgi:hypothetical protein